MCRSDTSNVTPLIDTSNDGKQKAIKIMLSAHQTEPERWKGQTDVEKKVWKYFNEVLAGRLIRAAMLRQKLPHYLSCILR